MGMSGAQETAFRLFATTHRPALRQAAFLLCGDWHKANDLVQTALNYPFGPDAGSEAHGNQPLPLDSLVALAEDKAFTF
jgi:hypothetical protein